MCPATLFNAALCNTGIAVGVPPLTPSSVSPRKDCVFTIDPSTARDLDDALSCRPLADGRVDPSCHPGAGGLCTPRQCDRQGWVYLVPQLAVASEPAALLKVQVVFLGGFGKGGYENHLLLNLPVWVEGMVEMQRPQGFQVAGASGASCKMAPHWAQEVPAGRTQQHLYPHTFGKAGSWSSPTILW